MSITPYRCFGKRMDGDWQSVKANMLFQTRQLKYSQGWAFSICHILYLRTSKVALHHIKTQNYRVGGRRVQWTNPSGHRFPDFGMDETRSKSWKTRLLAPAAFIATVYNDDSPDTDDPTASENIPLGTTIFLVHHIHAFTIHVTVCTPNAFNQTWILRNNTDTSFKKPDIAPITHSSMIGMH